MRTRTLALAALIAALAAGSASAQVSAGTRSVMDMLNVRSASYVNYQRGETGPLANLTLRAGAMLAPRTGGMVGVDFGVPSLSIGSGWHGRLDVDVIFKANFAGVDTIVPVTIDQIYYSPGGRSGHNFFYGGGIGAVLGGPGLFDGKLLIGTELASRLGAEFDLHFTKDDTIVTLMARIHL